MKMIWFYFHDAIPNTLGEIEFSFKNNSFQFQFVINKYRWYIKC